MDPPFEPCLSTCHRLGSGFELCDGFRLRIQSKDFPSFAPYVTDPGLEALPEHSPCMLWAPGSNPGLSTYHLSERTLIQVIQPRRLFGSTFRANAQTEVRNQDPSLTGQYSNWGSNPGPVTVGANSHIGIRAIAYRVSPQTEARSREPKLSVLLLRWFPGSSPGQSNCPLLEGSRVQIQKTWTLMKRVLRDSKPGSDAYVASTQTVDGTLNPVANKASAQTGSHSRDP
ncbi:hypothetical protein DPMN_107979 [Dreissena polymorpha]|uniref:Uncharacterized protein n=1 Tax=Dreissena polymorpha TaxID=45954 RepID=A0A9D4QLK1_DREPO|nr:hypothetical protein DPMN_107979 [Dreissena polymorpha]